MTDAKSVQELALYKNGVFAGVLERTEQGCRLIFDKSFLTSKPQKSFTFQILPTQESYQFPGVGLPAYFAGLLPEGLRLRALVRRVKTSEDDLFSLLVESGEDPVGDIHFKSSGSENIEEPAELPKDFSYLRTRLKEGEDPGHKSLPGVQDKISADRISLPVSIKKKNRSYILKLPSSEYPDIVANEEACLKIAKACGLQVNSAKVIEDSHGLQALLVERFDREWDVKSQQWKRFHQEDACQFLNRYPADKYRLSFQEIAKGVAEFSSSPEIEILNLLRLKAFSYLIGNGDLHAKNISLLQKDEVIQLSPAYDLVCTSLYGDHKMALMLDGKNQNLKQKNFLEFAERYDVPPAATLAMLEKLVVKFQKNKELLFTFPLAQKKEKALTQLFTERIRHLAEG